MHNRQSRENAKRFHENSIDSFGIPWLRASLVLAKSFATGRGEFAGKAKRSGFSLSRGDFRFFTRQNRSIFIQLTRSTNSGSLLRSDDRENKYHAQLIIRVRSMSNYSESIVIKHTNQRLGNAMLQIFLK